MRSYNDVRKDYLFDASIFNDEPERIRAVKDILNNRLDDVDRIIITLYADCGSYRKLATRMLMSHATVRKMVLRIREKIKKELENYDF